MGEAKPLSIFPGKTITRLFVQLFLLLTPGFLYAQTVQWAIKIGSNGDDEVKSIIADASGNIYAAGVFYGQTAFGTTTLTASTKGNAFIVKLNRTTGNILWAQQVGGTAGSMGMEIASDVMGNIHVSGIFKNTASFGTTTLMAISTGTLISDIFSMKLDAQTGSIIWAKQLDGPANSTVLASISDSLGNIFISGNFTGATSVLGTFTLSANGIGGYTVKIDCLTGNVLWANTVSGGSMVSDNSGNIYSTGTYYYPTIFGTYTCTSLGYEDVFLTKTDANGNIV
jgi:hypothetical protein